MDQSNCPACAHMLRCVVHDMRTRFYLHTYFAVMGVSESRTCEWACPVMFTLLLRRTEYAEMIDDLYTLN